MKARVSGLTYSLGEVAIILAVPGMDRSRLIRFLRQEGILLAGNAPARRYADRGYFQVVHQETTGRDGSLRMLVVTQVGEKGIEFIRRRLDEYLRQFMERQMLKR